MIIEDRIIKPEEKVVFKLRSLYRSFGYTCFKMSKFEEYDLYSQNKDFLVSDGIITFNDRNGKLLALKPDVTLSIVKNFKNGNRNTERVYYNENVYRASGSDSYKEIMQAGLECIGDITPYNLSEVLYLAAESLRIVSEECILNISHLGVLSAILSEINFSSDRSLVLSCIGEKNPHEILNICQKHNVSEEKTNLLIALTDAYGDVNEVAKKFKKLTDNKAVHSALDELVLVAKHASLSGIKICADLSLINALSYYNGLAFQGFVKGIPSAVLSGGQYDNLMDKMGKSPARAIGFAVYLDLLERLESEKDFDVDILLLYDEKDDIKDVLSLVSKLSSNGKTVCAQTSIPEKLTYSELIKFSK